MKLFQVAKSKNIADSIFQLLFYFSIFCAIISILPIIDRPFLSISSVIFNLIIALYNKNQRYRNILGSVYFSFLLAIYFSLPIAWICVRADSFELTKNFAAPLENVEYHQLLPYAILYLTIAIYFLIYGLTFNRSKKTVLINKNNRPNINILGLLFLSFFVFIINIKEAYRQIEYYSNRYFNNGDTLNQDILAFIFNDAAFLLFFSTIFYVIKGEYLDLKNSKNSIFYGAIFILYIIIGVISTSKAAILTSFILLFMYPLAVNSNYSNGNIYWPKKLFFLILLISAIVIFAVSLQSRMQLDKDSTLLNMVLNIIMDIDNIFENNIIPLLDRLSSTFTNYTLIFSHFGISYDLNYSIVFLDYMGKSFLNLILPGTPFLDSYFPTSNMLPDILVKNELSREGDSSTFWLYSNSQSFTIIGVFLIAFGPILTFPLLFLYGLFISILSNISRNKIYSTWVILVFSLIFISYGFEVALQTGIHFGVSFFILLFSLRILSRISILLFNAK